MPKSNDCVAMDIGCDQRLQFLDVFSIGEVIELKRILLPIEVGHRLGPNARSKREAIAIGTGDSRILLGLRRRQLGFQVGRLGWSGACHRRIDRYRSGILQCWQVGDKGAGAVRVLAKMEIVDLAVKASEL
jgi:hypothetical protein